MHRHRLVAQATFPAGNRTLFLHDSFRYGEEKALQRHYGLQSFAELENRWYQTTFHEETAANNGR
jgi:hypothetical protein